MIDAINLHFSASRKESLMLQSRWDFLAIFSSHLVVVILFQTHQQAAVKKYV